MTAAESHQKSTTTDGSKGSIPENEAGARIPRQFGRLTLLKPIASGGMGEVCLATAGGIEGAERPCVVKIIRREHAQDKSFLARFFDEARIQAQLQHPGVAQVLEAATDPSGKPFVVVEYVEGRNLGEVRQRASQLKADISWTDSIAIAVCITEALAHVHERTDAEGRPLSIVHRDLSPQNIMVGYGGEVKLIDFGTARGENRRCHTVSGIVYAKPGYVAPEVANNTPGGRQADLYALGIMLWELIAGRRFLCGDPAEHLAEVAAGRRTPAPLALSVNVPLELDTLIARLTAPRLQDRYETAREALTDLVRTLKKGPSLANGERSVRARIAHLMSRLYPVEPARSRAEFARLLAASRKNSPKSATLPESPLPGAVLDNDGALPGTRYRLLRQIASGQMGEVHEAEHIDLGRRVALKVLPRQRCDNPEFEARFRSEARAIARISHPNLVGLHDFGIASDGRPFYAMELLEGETLARRLEREGACDYREALMLGIQAASALEAAHEIGIIHRDIKPANLFLTRDGCLKLLDFGVAKTITEREKKSAGEALSVIGTPEYMAPEQASGGQIDERADIYALGAVIYELTTGYLPHSAPTTIAILDKKNRATIAAASLRAPGSKVPRKVDKLLAKALEIDPNDRYATMRELRIALEAARNQGVEPTRERSRLAFAALVLGGLAVSFGLLHGRVDHAVLARATSWITARVHGVQMVSSQPEITVSSKASSIEAIIPSKAAAAHPEPQVTAAPVPLAHDEDDEDVDEVTLADDDTTVKAAIVPAADAEKPTQSAPTKIAFDDGITVEHAGSDNQVGATKELDLNDSIQKGIDLAALYSKAGHDVAALGVYRALGKRYPEEPRLLQGWSDAAAATKGWGEALRIAIRWASTDTSAKAQLHLARLQNRVGQHYGAVATLQRLLEAQPSNEEAQSLLQRFGGSRVAMSH